MQKGGGSGLFSDWRLVPLLAALVLAVPLIWFLVYSAHAVQEEQGATQELSVIAQSKAREIENWLAERRGDARTLGRSTGFVERVDEFRRGGRAVQRPKIIDRLAALQSSFAYDGITLLDPNGTMLLTVGKPVDPPMAPARVAAATLDSDDVRMWDLYRDGAGHPRIGFSVALRAAPDGAPVGVAVLYVDPTRFLYPLVQAWPTNSESGETLLVRKDGDAVLYLNELRRRKGSSLQMRVPLSAPRLPATMAVRSGTTGSAAGVDYRNVSVLAAWRPLAGSDWLLIAKQDRAEALESVRVTASWAAAIAAVAMLLVGIAMTRLFRQQRVARDLSLRMQSGRLLAYFYDLPFIGMGVTAPDTKRWLQANQRLCEMLGYTFEELTGRTWADITHPDDLQASLEGHERVLRGEADNYQIEKRYLRKDGSAIRVRLDARAIRGPDGKPLSIASTVEDITEQHAAEERNRNLTRLYETLSKCNAEIIRATDDVRLLGEVCRIAVDSGGMRMAWAGLVDPDSREVRVVARYGSGTEYLDSLQISVDADNPTSRGPSGTCIREGHAVWCQDFAHDPRTGPWHEHGRRFGWGGSASLPLYRGGKAVGCLAFYVGTPNAFDKQTQALLTEITEDVSYGLESLALEHQRRTAAAALAESEERYRLLFDNSQDGILLSEPHGHVLAANGAACRIFGRTREALLQADRSELVDASDPRVAAADALRDRLGYFRGEITLRRGDGEAFPAEVSTTTFHEPGGQLRATMIVRDLTEKIRTEKTAERYLMQLQSALMHTVEVATTLSEMRDPYTAGHEKRVAQIAVGIATELGYDAKRLEGLQIAGYLHDIGKIMIPSEILSKPGKLTAAEYTLIKGHAQASYDVLKNVDFPWPIADMVLQHHERIDGTGYPQGLKGNAILPEARILAVADVVEAMGSHRPYRPGLGIERALQEIERGRGTAYDPEAADACLRIFREKGFHLPE